MKNLKTLSALAAALLSTTVFAGGLGLDIGANVGVGAGLGGVGLQGGVSQQSDAQVGAGQVGATVRQSTGIQGNADVDQRTAVDGVTAATAATARVTATTGAINAQNRSSAEVQSGGRTSTSANVDAEPSSNVRHAARRAVNGAQDTTLTARQSAQLQRDQSRERRLRASAGMSGSVRSSEQLQLQKPGSASIKANVKQSADLYSGG